MSKTPPSGPPLSILREMRTPNADKSYFALRLDIEADGTQLWSVFSHWIGFHSMNPLIEIRAASLVISERMIASWARRRQSYSVAERDEHLAVFCKLRGNLLLESTYAKAALPDILQPFKCMMIGDDLHFTETSMFPASISNRAPSRRLRMAMLKRDGYRCRICLRRPENNVDIGLEVHHIRPWGNGGATMMENLLTICDTCHAGLEPHYDPGLYALVPGASDVPSWGSQDDAMWKSNIVMVRTTLLP